MYLSVMSHGSDVVNVRGSGLFIDSANTDANGMDIIANARNVYV
jgi:hypothetical protein